MKNEDLRKAGLIVANTIVFVFAMIGFFTGHVIEGILLLMYIQLLAGTHHLRGIYDKLS